MHCYLGFTESFEGFFAWAEAIVGWLFGIATERCWLLSYAAGKLKSCKSKIVAADAVASKKLEG